MCTIAVSTEVRVFLGTFDIVMICDQEFKLCITWMSKSGWIVGQGFFGEKFPSYGQPMKYDWIWREN